MAPGRARSPDSRTTQTNAWKPPPATGTTSQNRADRYLGKGGSDDEGTPQSPGTRAELSSTGSGSKKGKGSPQNGAQGRGARRAQGSPNSKGTRRSSAGASPPEEEEEEEKIDWDLDDDEAADYQESWFAKESDALSPPLGKLREFAGEGKARSGMSNPPQNPKVQRQLLAYFHKHGVPPAIKATPSPPRAGSMRSISSLNDTSMSSTNFGSEASHHRGTPDRSGHDSRFRMSASAEGLHELDQGSPLNARTQAARAKHAAARVALNSAASSTSSTGHPAASAHKKEHGHQHQKGASSAPSLMQEKTEALRPSNSEFSRWKRDLYSKSRDHGFILDKTDGYELAQLNMYHNSLSRKMEQYKPFQIASPTAATAAGTPGALALRDIRSELKTSGDELAQWGSLTKQTSPKKRQHRRLHHTMGAEGGFNHPSAKMLTMSPQKLQELAEKVHDMSPSRLQSMARATSISVSTGAKVHTPHKMMRIATESEWVRRKAFAELTSEGERNEQRQEEEARTKKQSIVANSKNSPTLKPDLRGFLKDGFGKAFTRTVAETPDESW